MDKKNRTKLRIIGKISVVFGGHALDFGFGDGRGEE
jgi:hypothetical protein